MEATSIGPQSGLPLSIMVVAGALLFVVLTLYALADADEA